MDFPQRLHLENTIFALAEKLQARIYARSGRFFSPSKDNRLRALLEIYNAFFYRENWENFCAQESALEALCVCKIRTARTPVFSRKDYKFELIIGEERNAS